jgi:hypothetical protein
MVRDQAIDDEAAGTSQVEAVRFAYSGECVNTGGRNRG